METGEFKFAVDAQLIGELGERLVTNHYIALAELIKNAYDADSYKVDITLSNVTKERMSVGLPSSITIRDNGTGMSFDQIASNWMTIATSNKAHHPVSKIFGRPTTGNKGIGRFACQRLAEKLVIESTAKVGKQYQTTRVTFVWSDFQPGEDVTSIPCDYNTSLSRTGTCGLTLQLLGVRNYWTERDYKMLQKSVALISVASAVRRKGYKEDPGFNISVLTDEFEDTEVQIGQKMLNAGWGRLRGKVLKGGTLSLTLDCKGRESTEKYKVELERELEGVSFEIYIIPSTSRYAEVENRRNPTLLTQANRDAIRRDRGGIRLYLNNFRVYPYGDIQAGDDWLGISKDIARRRSKPIAALSKISRTIGVKDFNRSMLNHPGPESLVGEVVISGESTKYFTPKMDREGIVETSTFRALRQCIRLSLDWSTLHYEAFLRAEIDRAHNARVEAFINSTRSNSSTTKELVADALNVIKKSNSAEASHREPDKKSNRPDTSKNQPDKLVVQTTQLEVSAATELLESQFNAYDAELDTLRSVASTAPLMFVFSHEFKGIMSNLLTHAAKLETIANQTSEQSVSNQLLEMANEARSTTSQYSKIIKLFDVFSDSQNFKNKKVLVKNAINQVVGGFEYLLNEFSINVDVQDINPVLKMSKMNEAELYSIVINAVSNAVKAVIVKKSKRNIRVSVNSKVNEIEMLVLDTGVGLSQDLWGEVFNPFISDPEGTIYSDLSSTLGDQQLATLGRGSGLGLHIIKSIVTKHKGHVGFIKPPEGWSTCLRMSVPR